jgi:hypothetical protein
MENGIHVSMERATVYYKRPSPRDSAKHLIRPTYLFNKYYADFRIR